MKRCIEALAAFCLVLVFTACSDPNASNGNDEPSDPAVLSYESPTIGTLAYVGAGVYLRDAAASSRSVVAVPFRMSETEITRAQFQTVLGGDPSDASRSTGSGDPVQRVNWYLAIAFCNKLSLLEGLDPIYSVAGVDFSLTSYDSVPKAGAGPNAAWDAASADWNANGYRLPTELEWMWAAMGADKDERPGVMDAGVNVGGRTKAFSGYDGARTLGDCAVYYGNSGPADDAAETRRTRPAGGKPGNELGIFDLSGNVWEWCWDRRGDYPAGEVSSDSEAGRGAASGAQRIIRGGAYFSGMNDQADYAVSARSGQEPYSQSNVVGFRVVRN